MSGPDGETPEQTADMSGEKGRPPFALTIPVRITGHQLAEPSAVDIIAAGGLMSVGRPLVGVEVRFRSGDEAASLMASMPVGKGFELVLREIVTPGPNTREGSESSGT